MISILDCSVEKWDTILVTVRFVPVIITGNINVHLQHDADPDAIKLRNLLESFDVIQFVSEMTHQCGGTLNIIIAGAANKPQDVTLTDVRLSDHMMITWFACLTPPAATHRRLKDCRRILTLKGFVHDFQNRRCESQINMTITDVDMLADQYNNIITEILDELATVTEFSQKASSSPVVWWRIEVHYMSCTPLRASIYKTHDFGVTRCLEKRSPWFTETVPCKGWKLLEKQDLEF